MSAEARMKDQIAAAVREATAPLERAVEELSARLAAVESGGGEPEPETPKRPARGRTTKAKAQPAEVTAITGDGVKADTGGAEEKVPEQREASK